MEIAADYVPSFRDDTLAAARQILPATTALFLGADGTVSPPLKAEQWDSMAEAMAAVGLVPEGTDGAAAMTDEFSG